MSLGRGVLLLIVIAVGYWLYQSNAAVLTGRSKSPETSSSAPIERARAAARQSDELRSRSEALQREAESNPAGAVTENMTPEQVRRLLGSPDEVASETLESGVSRERWVYRSVGKTVVFESGIAVRIE